MAADAPAGSEARAILVDTLSAMSSGVVDREAEDLVRSCVTSAWRGGWQPSELARQARLRGSSATTARLGRLALAVDHASRRAAALDRRWSAQIDALQLPDTTDRRGWFRRWADDEGSDRATAVATVVDLLAVLVILPRLDHVIPEPGTTIPEPGTTASGVRTSIDTSTPATGLDPLLEKIRNLLAKAESTTYEAEATALTTKAQELMTRHAVDAATLHAGDPDRGVTPVTIRLPIDAPYVEAKSLLLQTVAACSRCRSVLHSGLDMSSVVGYPEDVVVVEMLFTSLLVQAQAALAAAAQSAPPGTRTRSQAYRSAFLLAYTHRIGDRLEEINRHVVDEATIEHGASFLPVLRSRSDRVDDHVRDRFGDLTSSAVRGGHDRAGWIGGRLAADQAAINLADLRDGDPTTNQQTPAAELD